MDDWRKARLDELGRIITGKTPPSSLSECFGGNIPFVTPTDLDGRRTILETGRYLTELGADLVSKRIPAGAVLVSCIGSDMGKAAIAGSECVTNQQINSIIVSDPDNSLFIYYNLSLRKDEIRNIASGSAQPILNKTAFGRLDIILPSPKEQGAIACILGTLDDRIELNQKMSETLEAMMRALFKSWFVDFEPVRAKADGRDPGLPKHIADLFPDAMHEYSGYGLIPNEWNVTAISEFASLLGGSTPSTAEPSYWDGPHNWATPKDLSTLRFPVLLDTDRMITESGLAKISSGLLPAGTVLLSSRAPIGYLAIAEIPVAINQGFIAMVPKETVSNIFLLLWAREAHEIILSKANGSTFLEISKKSFREILAVRPPAFLMDAFDTVSRALYKRIVSNQRQSRILTALRDTLLPKLISGELRVKDAERFISRAV